MKVRIYSTFSGEIEGEIATLPNGGLSFTPGTRSVGQLRGLVEEMRPYMADDGEIVQRTDAEVVASLPARVRNQSAWAEEVAEQ